MQLRRALLALLMIMVVSAFAAALVRRLAAGPVPPGTTTELVTEPTSTNGDAGEPRRKSHKARTESAPEDAELLELRAGRSREAAFEKGTHLVIAVRSREPGQAFIVGLGQLEPVTPGTPARFDLFLDRQGEFRVRVRPVEGSKDLDAGVLRVGPADKGGTAPPNDEQPGPTGARPGA
jgi:hypothetical protein